MWADLIDQLSILKTPNWGKACAQPHSKPPKKAQLLNPAGMTKAHPSPPQC